jgi:alpha-amylase
VREGLTEWLLYLRRSIGFDGWRFDYVRGYSGGYAKAYVDATVPQVRR